MSQTATQDALRATALRYIADRAVLYLLQVGEPAKTGQITGFVGEEYPVSTKVVRDALTLDPRFVQRERRWDLAARDINTQHPLERTITDFLTAVGRPLTVETIGVEIAKATGTPVETETETVRRLVSRRPNFVLLDEDRISPTDWVLDVSSGNPEDVLFENFDDPNDVDRYRKTIPAKEWKTPIPAATTLINKVGNAVSGKAMAYLAYESIPTGFDPVAFHRALVDSKLIRLSDGTWITPAVANSLVPVWDGIAEEPPVEGAPEEAARTGEITITPADMEEIAHIVHRTEGLVTSRQLLEQVLEVSPQDADYEKWEAVLADALQQQGELINVGWDRWRRFETIPTYILDAPESLSFQTYSFQTAEGEDLDVEMSDDGLDGNLKELVNTPLAQMGGECVRQGDGSARCTFTVLHHDSGTLPVGGDDPYFPTEPAVVEATILGPQGRFPLWINNTLGLAFGLDEIYADLPESGPVFVFRPTNRAGEYRLELSDELDPRVGIDEARLKELRGIAARPSFAETSTFDLLGEILERHRKGADFFTLLAELWVMRPVTAQLVASLLSGYYCYKQNKNGSWSFDPREVDKGFKKSKRKYVI